MGKGRVSPDGLVHSHRKPRRRPPWVWDAERWPDGRCLYHEPWASAFVMEDPQRAMAHLRAAGVLLGWHTDRASGDVVALSVHTAGNRYAFFMSGRLTRGQMRHIHDWTTYHNETGSPAFVPRPLQWSDDGDGYQRLMGEVR